MQIKRKVKFLIRLSSLGALGALGLAMICPVAPEAAWADVTEIWSVSDTLGVSVSKGTVALNVDPSVNGGIARGSTIIYAKTTNETGYTLRVNASGTTAMKSTTSTNTATVPTLSANTVLTSFPANRWGYYVGASEGTNSSTYKPFSTTATQIDATTAPNATSRAQTFTIAAKVNNTLPASTYTASIVVSVVSNPPKPTFGSIRNMQEMTSSVCASIGVDKEGTLIDTRDNTVYQVRRMQDGNCWMTQNLALNIPATGLKASDTDITADWNSSSTYPPVATGSTVASSSTAATTTGSWNFGKWVLATPLLAKDCGNANDSTTLSKCTTVGLVDVSNATNFKPTYTAETRSWEGANSNTSTLVTVNCTSWSGSGTSKICTAGTYDPHYLIGNYYTWGAATAGTGGTIKSAVASGSICPKGWQLPRAVVSSVSLPDGSITFTQLLSSFDLGSSVSGTYYNVAGHPIRFVRAGYVGIGTAKYVARIGINGYLWSATTGSINPSGMACNASQLFASYTENPRQYGYPVRCVAGYE